MELLMNHPKKLKTRKQARIGATAHWPKNGKRLENMGLERSHWIDLVPGRQYTGSSSQGQSFAPG